MRQTAAVIGPFRIVKRQDQLFEVRKGRAVLSRHGTFADAEDRALWAWLHKRHDDEVDYSRNG
jgi:hypothetical protein